MGCQASTRRLAKSWNLAPGPKLPFIYLIMTPQGFSPFISQFFHSPCWPYQTKYPKYLSRNSGHSCPSTTVPFIDNFYCLVNTEMLRTYAAAAGRWKFCLGKLLIRKLKLGMIPTQDLLACTARRTAQLQNRNIFNTFFVRSHRAVLRHYNSCSQQF